MAGERIRLGELDLAAYAGTAVALQAAALATVGNEEVSPTHVEAYARHATYPGFRAVGAWRDEELVGFCYGHEGAAGQWWHDQVAPSLRGAGHDGWLARAAVLVELHVRPDLHGHGTGPRLLAALSGQLGQDPQAGPDRMLLSTDDLDTPARRLYRRAGFTDLLTGFRFSSTYRPFAIMGAPLPLRLPPVTTQP